MAEHYTRIATTRRYEIVLPTPCIAKDMARVLSAVIDALPDERANFDDAYEVRVDDDAIVIWWPEPTTYEDA